MNLLSSLNSFAININQIPNKTLERKSALQYIELKTPAIMPNLVVIKLTGELVGGFWRVYELHPLKGTRILFLMVVVPLFSMT